MKKLIGLVAVLAALGALVASFASAEEVPSQTPPAATEGSQPTAPESQAQAILCGNICVYPLPYFQGPTGVTSCFAPGAHPLPSNKASIENGCSNVAVWMRRQGTGETVGCKNPGTSNNNSPIFNELWVGVNGSRC
jgi:hypothetical protein